MTRIQYLILFYGLSAALVGYLLIRLSRGKSGSAQSGAEKEKQPLAEPVREPVVPAAQIVVPPAPVPEIVRAPEPVLRKITPEPVVTTPPAVPAAATAGWNPTRETAASYQPNWSGSGESVYRTATSEGQLPQIYAGLLGKSTSATPPLPTISAVQTGLAGNDDYVYGNATPVLASLLPESAERRNVTLKELQTAGYYEPHAAENLAATRYLFIMIPLALLGLMLLFVPRQFELLVLGSMLVVPLLGWALPRLVVKSQAKERLTQIERAMPDMLDMLSMCVSQGMTLPAALKRVSNELESVHPALHKELQIVSEQSQIGTLRGALENFSRRIDLPEVQSFTSLLVQTERMGTSVTGALSEYSDNIRASLKQRADEKGNQAAFKLLFPTVLCLMPAVYMFLLGPSILELANFVNRDDTTLRDANRLLRQQGGQVIRGGLRE